MTLNRQKGTLKRFLFFIISFAVLFPVAHRMTEAAPTSEINLNQLLRSDNNIRVIYFNVSGNTVSEIRKSLDQTDQPERRGIPGDAYTKWRIDWKWPYKKGSLPDFSKTKSSYKIWLYLPLWEPSEKTTNEVVEKWNSFLSAVIKHEMGHINNLRRNYKEVAERIRKVSESNPKLTIEQANQIAEKEISKLRTFDTTYDQETGSGKTQGVSLI